MEENTTIADNNLSETLPNDDVQPEIKEEKSVEISENEKANDEMDCDEKEETKDENLANPFAYCENSAFTSEKFKLELKGLPRYFGMKELRKFLNVKLELNCNKVKCPSTKIGKRAYICFRSKEERDNAQEILDDSFWKNCKLQTKVCGPVPDPLILRRNRIIRTGVEDNIDTLEKQAEALQNSVSHLWRLPYEEQLAQKMKACRQALNRLGVSLKKNRCLNKWLGEQKQKNDGLPCKLLDIQFLKDVTEKYRNKSEFTIARNELTGKRAVGYRLGTYASGSLGVASVEGIKTIPDRMVEATKVFEKYVQDSEYDVYSPETLTGHWRILTARLGVLTNQLMLIINFDPQDLSQGKIKQLKDDIREFFDVREGASLKVDSLFFKLLPRNTKGQNQFAPELLLGKPFIKEILCGLTFRISPESFFQTNTRCAELLINSTKQLAKVDKDTVVLDICCGTGTLGLCLANDCKKVMGIEISEQAVKDAKINAENNKIDNCEFFCGKADEILTSVINKVKDENLVAIVDPPRAGLHKNAVHMLRKAKNLNRFVYLSCDVNSALNNLVELGRNPSKMLQGDPFVPIAAIPVDMFPQTNHYELVIYFERLSPEQLNG